MTEAELEQTILGLDGVSKRYAFNGDGYYVRARLFAFLEPGGIVLRLPEPERSDALARDGARAWTMPRTSTRLAWTFVPFGEGVDREITAWAKSACAFVVGSNT